MRRGSNSHKKCRVHFFIVLKDEQAGRILNSMYTIFRLNETCNQKFYG